ncbi:MAG: hypothetical protein DI629_11990 [Mesorhizobium amorphae]|nr:MAG: hypothetical protein DI629_11990 [Mesorhizobium amorphae]
MTKLSALPSEKIGLPHDGQTIVSRTLSEMLDVVLMLKGEGYYVPDWLEPAIRDEIAEEPASLPLHQIKGGERG